MSQRSSAPYLKIGDENFRMASDEMREARDRSWYARTDWGIAVLSYEDNSALMKDTRLSQGSTKWPAHHGVLSGPYHDWWRKTLLVLEGDEHNRIRRVVNPAFSPRRIDPLRPGFATLANALIDEWISDGKTDFVTSFAAPYSARVLCMVLGLDERHWKDIYCLSATLGLGIGVTVKDNINDIDHAVIELTQYAEALIRDRRASPRQDIVSALVAPEAGGESQKLSNTELANLVVLLIFAGIDTTRSQLSLSLGSFSRQPEQWEKLASDPRRYGVKAVEEALRVNPVARWVTREAVESFQYKGLPIERGTTVHMFTLSSGTDPAEYAHPDRIDLDAVRSPHFAFGGGMHHCLGHFVARADLNVALMALAARVADVRVGTGAKWLPDSGNTGADSLPITFRAR